MGHGNQSIEHVQEHMHHEAEHGSGPKWVGLAALTAAIIAALAAISGSVAGIELTKSSRDQIEANNNWSHFQSKSVKQAMLQSKIDILGALGKDIAEDDVKKKKEYDAEKDDLMNLAKVNTASSHHHLHAHETLEHGVTMFHVAIAIVAVSVLSKRKAFFYASLGFAAVGLVFGAMGMNEVINAGHNEAHKTAPTAVVAPSHGTHTPSGH